MNRTKILVLTAFLTCTTGCLPSTSRVYTTVSTHELKAGPEREADVIWLIDKKSGLLRCYDSAVGPVCVRVKTTDTAPPPRVSTAIQSAPAAAPAPALPAPTPTPGSEPMPTPDES